MDTFDLLKSHIDAYTKKSGVMVRAHDTKAAPKRSDYASAHAYHKARYEHHSGKQAPAGTGATAMMIMADKAERDSDQKPGTTGAAFDGPAQPPASDDADQDARLDHPAYTTPVKMKGYNRKEGITPHQATSSRDAANVIIKNKPDWSKEDHAALAEKHRAAADKHHEDWSKTADEAAQKTWGRKFGFGDYKVSGIGSDEFSDEHKEALRNHAHSAGKHSTLAAAHAAAAKSRLTK